uniref:C2 domain-containing protein n=1 Tax=Globodera rostochiensis TaxID=31243 RepID=A0A914I904_GLORO
MKGPVLASSAFRPPLQSASSMNVQQLNCTVSVSRSGSDAEIVADPSILGFDPSLYTNGPSSVFALSSACSGGSFSGPSSAHSAIMSAEQPSTSALSSDEQPRPRGLGLIHCTLQHFPVRKRLRVNVLKIEGLAGELRPDLEIQPFCKLLLTPGKKQQQQSVVKRGRDAEFFFDGVATEEIDSKQLQIEVCHNSAQKLQKDLEIGEVRIPLRDITQQLYTKKEVRIVEELKLFTVGKKLGKLHISTCIEREARRLTINLHKAEDLPKWGITGAPDVQIRIRMQQGNGPEAVKSSRVLKNTTTAVYKEAVMFLISIKEADLTQTKIAITVHDLSRSVTGNDIIGSVFLGELAVDKSELDQWRNTVEHLGKEFKGAHVLKGPQGQGTPEVHVLDVQDDDVHED